jgi:hypothetical protein
MIKLLFNYSLYSHPEIGNFRVWHACATEYAHCPKPVPPGLPGSDSPRNAFLIACLKSTKARWVVQSEVLWGIFNACTSQTPTPE